MPELRPGQPRRRALLQRLRCGARESPSAERESRARSSRCSSATSSARRRSASPPTPRRSARGCAATSRICARSSSGTAARWRSSSAMRSWPSSASPSRTRTTLSAPCARRRRCSDAVAAHGLEARIGVNTGEVVVGGQGETLVTGDAVNVAARLEQAAPPGTILIGGETRLLVRDAVRRRGGRAAHAEGEVRAGRRLPARRGARGRRARRRAISSDRSSDASGSGSAFGATTRTLSPTATCRLFTLLGPAGIGKSRLVADFLEHAAAGRATSCAAVASPTAKGSPTGRSSRS